MKFPWGKPWPTMSLLIHLQHTSPVQRLHWSGTSASLVAIHSPLVTFVRRKVTSVFFENHLGLFACPQHMGIIPNQHSTSSSNTCNTDSKPSFLLIQIQQGYSLGGLVVPSRDLYVRTNMSCFMANLTGIILGNQQLCGSSKKIRELSWHSITLYAVKCIWVNKNCVSTTKKKTEMRGPFHTIKTATFAYPLGYLKPYEPWDVS